MRINSYQFLIGLVILCFIFSSCGSLTKKDQLQDGYYAAESKDFDKNGWKEYVRICVHNNKIISVEYNSRNESGFIKAWDMNYMKTMNKFVGTYPNYYARSYAKDFLETQEDLQIDAITGATSSYNTFNKLAKAVIERSKAGDESIVLLP